jgi:hypothetical protein
VALHYPAAAVAWERRGKLHHLEPMLSEQAEQLGKFGEGHGFLNKGICFERMGAQAVLLCPRSRQNNDRNRLQLAAVSNIPKAFSPVFLWPIQIEENYRNRLVLLLAKRIAAIKLGHKFFAAGDSPELIAKLAFFHCVARQRVMVIVVFRQQDQDALTLASRARFILLSHSIVIAPGFL